jgi:DNA polymerase-4
VNSSPPANRKIIHIDADCFYAAVEVRDNPELRGKAIAVGGSATRRGVIATASYEARKFGIHSAMASATAVKRCPQLILIPGRMSVYREASRQMHEIFSDYTDLIEPLSLDEAFLDVSACPRCRGSATLIAQEIRKRIADDVGITVSAGVAPNKFIAKVASDMNKPDGQYVVTPQQIDEFLISLPVKRIWGVGKVTAQRLDGEPCGTESFDCSAIAVTFTEDNACQFNPIAPNEPTEVQGISHVQREVCRGFILAAAGATELICN